MEPEQENDMKNKKNQFKNLNMERRIDVEELIEKNLDELQNILGLVRVCRNNMLLLLHALDLRNGLTNGDTNGPLSNINNREDGHQSQNEETTEGDSSEVTNSLSQDSSEGSNGHLSENEPLYEPESPFSSDSDGS